MIQLLSADEQEEICDGFDFTMSFVLYLYFDA